MGEAITTHLVGPYLEGVSVAITCLASGGSPPPKVTWWYDNVLIDETDQGEPSGRVRNELLLGQLDRGHSGRRYLCKAVNDDILAPLEEDVWIEMYRKFH